MKRIFGSGLLACLVTFAQPQVVHAAPFTIEHETSWFGSGAERIAPLGGHVEAEWVESGLARYFRFTGGSSVEVAHASHRQSIAYTTLGEGTAIEAGVQGGFDVHFEGLAFDIVQGDARNGDAASSLSWKTIGELPRIQGTLNVAVSSLLGDIATTFEYSGRLLPEETPFRPSVGTVLLDETFLGLAFDVAFDLSIDSISSEGNLGSLDESVLALVHKFLSEQQYRYYGSLVALEANDPPPVSVSEPHTLALLVAGAVLAGARRTGHRNG